MINILNNEDISVLDRQIEQLMDFKPIPEHEVKQLCEKVSHFPGFYIRFSKLFTTKFESKKMIVGQRNPIERK
jgi:hypothetical protein